VCKDHRSNVSPAFKLAALCLRRVSVILLPDGGDGGHRMHARGDRIMAERTPAQARFDKARRLRMIKRYFPLWLLAVLGLLLSLGVFMPGLRWMIWWRLVVGYLGMAACGVWMATLATPKYERRRNEELRYAVGFGAAAVLVLILGVGTKTSVRAACAGEGVTGAAAYAPHPGAHPAVVLHRGRTVHRLPPEWRPASKDDTELVACFGDIERDLIETCSYAGGAAIKRYRFGAQLTLVEARTGEVVATKWFWGDPPRACKQSEDRSVRSLKGDKEIDMAAVEAWLSAYVLDDVAPEG